MNRCTYCDTSFSSIEGCSICKPLKLRQRNLISQDMKKAYEIDKEEFDKLRQHHQDAHTATIAEIKKQRRREMFQGMILALVTSDVGRALTYEKDLYTTAARLAEDALKAADEFAEGKKS